MSWYIYKDNKMIATFFLFLETMKTIPFYLQEWKSKARTCQEVFIVLYSPTINTEARTGQMKISLNLTIAWVLDLL